MHFKIWVSFVQRQAGFMCQSEAWENTSVYFIAVYEESKYQWIVAYRAQLKQSYDYLSYFAFIPAIYFSIFFTKMKILINCSISFHKQSRMS